MKTAKRIFLLVVLMLVENLTMGAQTPNPPTPIPGDSIGFSQFPPSELGDFGLAPWDDDLEGPHKAPAPQQELPVVTYNTIGESLAFTGVEPLTILYYYVIDTATNKLCLSDEITLAAGSHEYVSTTVLSDGNYTFILKIGPNYYIGEFTISRE